MTPALALADVRGAPVGSGPAVILLHGRDQDPQWMYDHVVARLGPALDDLPVTWVAPAAPGRAWYAGRVHDELGSTLAERDRAAAVVDGLAAELPAPAVLAGFSQGACLVADHLLRRPHRWAAALIWTGAAFGPAGTSWPAAGRPLAGLPVLASTSDVDPWIALSATEELVTTLRAHGADVAFRVEPGRDHEVADGEIAAAAAVVRRAVG